MSLAIKYICCRDGVYYYHRRVPKAVIDRPAEHSRLFAGQPSVRVSLRTKDATLAARQAASVHIDFERKVNEALGLVRMVPVPVPLAQAVTRAKLTEISESRRSRIARQFGEYVVQRELDGLAKEYADHMIDRFEWNAEAIRRALIDDQPTDDPSLDLDAMALSVIESERLDASPGSPAYAGVRRAIREGELQGYRDASDILSGNLSVINTFKTDQRQSAMLLSTAVNEHVNSQSKTRTVTAIRTALRKFMGVVGDRPLDKLRPDDFRQYCRHEASRDVGGRSKRSVKRPVSKGTIQKDIRLLSGAISSAIDRGEFEGPNPASKINVAAFTRPVSPAVIPEKRPFELDELNEVFRYPWFTGCASSTDIHRPGTHRLTGAFYWGPILALLTGCRAGELGGLALDEVDIDGQFPHINIRDNAFRTTKGSYSRRVPLIDQLMALGFAEFVEQRRQVGGTRLFDDWKPPSSLRDTNDPAWSNGKMIRAFNSTLIPNALRGRLIPEARREVTFHSFRGAFKKLLVMNRYGISPNYVHEVIGHSKSALDKRYVKAIPLEETYPAIRKCRFDGLALPSAP